MVIATLKTGLEILSGLLLMALMSVTGIDVIARYIFDAPLPGAFEMTELLLGLLVFAALPLVGLSGSHVEVDLLVGLMPKWLGTVLLWIAAALSAAVLMFFAWRLLLLGLQQIEDGTRSISLSIPFGPVAFFGAAACALSALFGILRARRP